MAAALQRILVALLKNNIVLLPSGWWLVDRDGELGWAPASYLEPTDDGSEDTITTQTFGPGEGEGFYRN